jgi:hypothetical protein
LGVPLPEQASQNPQAGWVVVHHKYLQAMKVGLWRFFPAWRGRAKAGGKVKRASLPYFALQPDFPAHHLDQSRGDGQPQPRATESPPGRAIGLRKGVKDNLVLVRGNSDASVSDGEMQTGISQPVDFLLYG